MDDTQIDKDAVLMRLAMALKPFARVGRELVVGKNYETRIDPHLHAHEFLLARRAYDAFEAYQDQQAMLPDAELPTLQYDPDEETKPVGLQERECPHCKGKGYDPPTVACDHCGGSGVLFGYARG